jgi:hypothetical protein
MAQRMGGATLYQSLTPSAEGQANIAGHVIDTRFEPSSLESVQIALYEYEVASNVSQELARHVFDAHLEPSILCEQISTRHLLATRYWRHWHI